MNNVLALQELSADEVTGVEVGSEGLADGGGQEADLSHHHSHISLLLCHY